MNKPASELIALADREAFIEVQGKYLDLTECSDAWGRPMFMHPLIQAMWDGWRKGRDALRTAANQSGSERAGVEALEQRDRDIGILLANIRFLEEVAGESLEDDDASMVRQIEREHKDRATPPAQPAPAGDSPQGDLDERFKWLADEAANLGYALTPEPEHPDSPHRQAEAPSTHCKPDGAVREALCCSSISPCEYQRTHRTGVCETCQKAAALSPKIATAETSPGDVIAMKEVLGHIRTAILEARLEVVTDTLWMPERLSKNETVVDYIAAAIARLDVKAEAKSQEPEAYLADDRMAQIDYSVDLQRIIEDLCRDRPIREPKTGARYHYDMAVAHHPTTKPEAPAVSVDAIKRDAERYRLIRNRNSPLEAHANDEHLSAYHIVGGVRELKWGDNLDRAIDAALIAGGR